MKIRVLKDDEGTHTVVVIQEAPGYALSEQKRGVPTEEIDRELSAMIQKARTPIAERAGQAPF